MLTLQGLHGKTQAGFESVKDSMAELEERLSATDTDAREAVRELQGSIDKLYDNVRAHRKMNVATRASGLFNNDGHFWENESQARDFAGLVLCAAKIRAADSEGDGFTKAMGTGANVDGGVLVGEELRRVLIQKLGQYGKFRRNVTPITMGEARVRVPRVVTDLVVYCPGEGNTITASDVEFDDVELDAKAVFALATFSRELDEDSMTALGEIIGASVVRSMAKKEDEVGFVGDGTSAYFGMTGICQSLFNVDAVIGNIAGIYVGSGNAYSELTLEDFEGVVAIAPDDVDDEAKWYVHRRFFFQVMHKLARAAGAADMLTILSNVKQRYYLGYPVEFVHSMPYAEANSQICALFGDLRLGAYLGQRKEMFMERSNDVFFENYKAAILAGQRIDINAFGVGDTSEAGPIVALATAAS
jgi:HK97 family phage major capsid protein